MRLAVGPSFRSRKMSVPQPASSMCQAGPYGVTSPSLREINEDHLDISREVPLSGFGGCHPFLYFG